MKDSIKVGDIVWEFSGMKKHWRAGVVSEIYELEGRKRCVVTLDDGTEGVFF